ncbi:MAG: YlbG family protein [Streptococcaceae bacterium]|jgi:uncharacterized protein YlbG (UPF0298 family)|nr:YlbG family protein [Streptococcaceae bacterium]
MTDEKNQVDEKFEMAGRKPIYVFYKSKKNVHNLSKYGEVVFVSEKKNYACLYLDKEKADEISIKLTKLPFVKSVKQGQMMDLAADFGEAFQEYVQEEKIKAIGQ